MLQQFANLTNARKRNVIAYHKSVSQIIRKECNQTNRPFECIFLPIIEQIDYKPIISYSKTRCESDKEQVTNVSYEQLIELKTLGTETPFERVTIQKIIDDASVPKLTYIPGCSLNSAFVEHTFKTRNNVALLKIRDAQNPPIVKLDTKITIGENKYDLAGWIDHLHDRYVTYVRCNQGTWIEVADDKITDVTKYIQNRMESRHISVILYCIDTGTFECTNIREMQNAEASSYVNAATQLILRIPGFTDNVKSLLNKLQPLTDAQKQQVVDKLHESRRDPEMSITISLKGRSFARLDPEPRSDVTESWLNCDIINEYTELLNERSARKGYKYFCPNTGFAVFLFTKEHAKVDKIMRKFKLLDKDILLIPYNVGGNHWVLIIVDTVIHKWQYLDPMGGSLTKEREAILTNFFRRKFEFDFKEHKIILNIPQQKDMCSCGVFVCEYADYITDNCPLYFSTADIAYFRIRIGWNILNRTLTLPETEAETKEIAPVELEEVEIGTHTELINSDISPPGSLQNGKTSAPIVTRQKVKTSVPIERKDEYTNPKYTRKQRCFFNPHKSCGSFVRTGFSYKRDVLIEHAKRCGIKFADELSIDTLCHLLRARYYEQKRQNHLVAFFSGGSKLPGYGFRWGDIQNRNLLEIKLFDLLLPIPEDLHVLQRFETSRYALTIPETAVLLSTPIALQNYKTSLDKIIDALGVHPEKGLNQLVSDNTFLLCKMLLRLLVSSYILAPTRYNKLHSKLQKIETKCNGVDESQTLAYADLFKKKVLQYTAQHYDSNYNSDFFVEFYSDAKYLDFKFAEYFTSPISFIKSMVVFPVTLEMSYHVEMMEPVIKPPFPLNTSILATNLQHIDIIAPKLERAMVHAFKELQIDVDDDQSNIIRKIRQSELPMQRITELLGRILANATWFSVRSYANKCEKILTELDESDAQLLRLFIDYTEYEAWSLLKTQGKLEQIQNKITDWGNKPIPRSPFKEQTRAEVLMSEDED